MAGLTWDHVLIWVADLERAIADYERLGFRVSRGGRHPALGTHNAIIPLADGSYLELIAADPAGERAAAGDSAAHRRIRVRRRDGEEGLMDWALLPDDTPRVMNRVRQRGLPLAGPTEGQRLRPDGTEVVWHFGIPRSEDIPFLCGDVTPRERRVPPGEARDHPNGATGIHALTVAVNDLVASAPRYRALLGEEGRRDEKGQQFTLGDGTLTVVERAGREGPVALDLASRGAEGTLDPALTHGAEIRLVAISRP